MKFQREDLIKRVKDEIAERERLVAEFNAKAAAEFDKRAEAHVAATSEGWRLFAIMIRRRLRTGTPVTFEDVPVELRHDSGWNDRLNFYGTGGPTERTANVAGLRTTLAVLEACQDDVVTTSGLEAVGIKAGDLFR